MREIWQLTFLIGKMFKAKEVNLYQLVASGQQKGRSTSSYRISSFLRWKEECVKGAADRSATPARDVALAQAV
jgi:hypothetical protein